MNVELMRHLFDTWLTVTFATIIAAFIARHELTTRLRVIIGCLYLLLTANISAGWWMRVLENGQLLQARLKFAPINEGPWFFAGASLMAVVFFGVATTLYFLFRAHLDSTDRSEVPKSNSESGEHQ